MEKDARETKARMDAENKALKDKLDKEAAELKKKLQVKQEKAPGITGKCSRYNRKKLQV